MHFSKEEIQVMTDQAHELLTRLTNVTISYLGQVKSKNTAIIVQGALGIYLKKVLESALVSMTNSKEDKIEFIKRFKEVMIQTIDEIEIERMHH